MAVSYGLAAAAALLSALGYAEFMADMPFSGGAFNCVLLTFGELAGWCAAGPLEVAFYGLEVHGHCHSYHVDHHLAWWSSGPLLRVEVGISCKPLALSLENSATIVSNPFCPR